LPASYKGQLGTDNKGHPIPGGLFASVAQLNTPSVAPDRNLGFAL
jgi:hypothetical protein